MHGRVKVRTSKEQEIIRQAEKQKKADQFKKGIELVFSKRKKKEWDDELLIITEKLLVRHPDVYSLWNIRREVFLNNNWLENEKDEKLEKELSITEISLRENPKSYCAWHHRTWVIEHLTKPNWKKELALCNKCLELDERNFHCWDYRLFIVKSSCTPDKEELEFTQKKILDNFSNYSAWHYRSKLLKKMHPSPVHDSNIEPNKHNEELDLVLNATFTDPNDSSAWIYNKWLLNYQESSSNLWQAILSTTRLTVAFNKDVQPNLKLNCDDQPISCKWNSTNKKKFSPVWYCTFDKPLIAKDIHLVFEEKVYNLKPLNSSNIWIYKEKTTNENHRSLKIKEQLKFFKELSNMEPSNKWTKLAIAFIMTKFDPVIDEYSSIIEEWDQLIKVDPDRINYYLDMRSKCILEQSLLLDNDQVESDINFNKDLSNLKLTTIINYEPYLAFYHNLNLRNNKLKNNLHCLHALQECNELDLSNNEISSLQTFPVLENLKILLLLNNQIEDHEELIELIKKHNLIKIGITGNPINKDLLILELKNSLLNVEVI